MKRYLGAAVLAMATMFNALDAQTEVPVERVTIEDEVSELVRRYVDARVDQPLFRKPCLNLGGDVRIEYNHYDEKRRLTEKEREGLNVGDINQLLRFPSNAFSVTGTIYMEYDTCRTWAKTRLEAVNPGDSFPSPTPPKMKVRLAVIGYNILKNDCERWYVELGRSRIGNYFESQVQFGSRLDGVFTRYSKCMPKLGEAYAQAAFMVLNMARDQFAAIFSIGAMNIYDQCIYAKLSYIDWMGSRALSRSFRLIEPGIPVNVEDLVPDRGYRIFQLVVGKKFENIWRCKNLKTYVGILYNTMSRPRVTGLTKTVEMEHEDGTPVLDGKGKQATQEVFVGQSFISGNRTAWYIGAQLGEVCKCGQWAAKAVFQYVEPFSILPADNQGIGRTNVPGNNDLFYVGFNVNEVLLVTNYAGIDVELAYALTDHVTVRVQYQYAQHIDERFFGPTRFNRGMIRTIYAF